jgi:hypothetical protein
MLIIAARRGVLGRMRVRRRQVPSRRIAGPVKTD